MSAHEMVLRKVVGVGLGLARHLRGVDVVLVRRHMQAMRVQRVRVRAADLGKESKGSVSKSRIARVAKRTGAAYQ